MKKMKRNVVIVALLLFVAAAAYLNWSYGKNGTDGETFETNGSVSDETQVVDGDNNEETSSDLYYEMTDNTSAYFDEARLKKTRSRDEAKAALAAISEIEGASQEAVDEALTKMTQIAERSLLESELESMICAKGFSDCVVYISDTGVTVTVVPQTVEGLSSAAIARITDTVTEKTGISAEELNIVEIK